MYSGSSSSNEQMEEALVLGTLNGKNANEDFARRHIQGNSLVLNKSLINRDKERKDEISQVFKKGPQIACELE